MKNWQKTALLTTLILTLLLYGISKIFNLKLAITSSKEIHFSPAKISSEFENEDFSEKPKNIIVFIADGMGFSHLSLALLSQQSEESTSVWEEFNVKGWHDARSSYGPTTDSGASATALATGTSAFFEVIGLNKEGNTVPNVFELASAQHYNTGIVTDSYFWDATPAAFVAHTKSRDNAKDIMTQIASSELDLIFGELEDVGEEDNPDKQTTLKILQQRYQLLDEALILPKADSILIPIAAIFNEDQVQDMNSSPNLFQLTDAALRYLSSQDEPFILLVECEEMDAASHRNQSARILRGLESIQKTLALIFEYSKENGETLVLFTADHETGGLAIGADYDNYPNMKMLWPTKDHTATVVPILAHGPGARYFADVQRNWEIGKILKNLISPG